MTTTKPQCECLKVLGDIAEALALEGQKEKADAVFEAVGQLRTHNILREHMHDSQEGSKP
jgi:hypothetical protein